MTILDDIIPDEVVSVLATYGVDVVFTVDTDPVYDPTTGTVTKTSSTATTVKSAPPYKYARQYINGDTIREGDVCFLIAPPSTWGPVLGQKIAFGGQTWRAVSVNPIYSGSLIAAYEIQGRQ